MWPIHRAQSSLFLSILFFSLSLFSCAQSTEMPWNLEKEYHMKKIWNLCSRYNVVHTMFTLDVSVCIYPSISMCVVYLWWYAVQQRSLWEAQLWKAFFLLLFKTGDANMKLVHTCWHCKLELNMFMVHNLFDKITEVTHSSTTTKTNPKPLTNTWPNMKSDQCFLFGEDHS